MREIRKIKVCESKRYNHSTNVLEKFCSIKIIDSQKKDPYFPVYPFSDLEHKAVLQEFVDLYEQELLEFYKNGWNYNFASFCIVNDYNNTIYGISRDLDLSMVSRFRDRWFKKGVVFH